MEPDDDSYPVDLGCCVYCGPDSELETVSGRWASARRLTILAAVAIGSFVMAALIAMFLG